MLINLQSDLHLEFHKAANYVPPFLGEDILALPGDIQVGWTKELWFLELLKYRHVLYVPGNHEYYGHRNFYTMNHSLRDWTNAINKNAAEHGYKHKLYSLLDESVVIDGVRFIGSTLWTDYQGEDPYTMDQAHTMLADYRQIEGQPFMDITSKELLEVHKNSRRFIEKALRHSENLITVVLTHHLPSARSTHPRWVPSPSDPAFKRQTAMNYLFCSDLEEVVMQADYWFHGHTHDSFDYKVGNCRVVANPRGYPMYGSIENEKFNPQLLIEV